jgi:hypothetical protein
MESRRGRAQTFDAFSVNSLHYYWVIQLFVCLKTTSLHGKKMSPIGLNPEPGLACKADGRSREC